jgi:hypothetical protein
MEHEEPPLFVQYARSRRSATSALERGDVNQAANCMLEAQKIKAQMFQENIRRLETFVQKHNNRPVQAFKV